MGKIVKLEEFNWVSGRDAITIALCNTIIRKQNEIIDHLNSQAQPEENEEWEKRFIRTFGYWGEEIKFIKQLLKEREREVLEDIKGVNNEIYEGRTEILEVEIDNRLDKLNKEEK